MNVKGCITSIINHQNNIKVPVTKGRPQESLLRDNSVFTHNVAYKLAKDLLHPSPAEERRKCKLKRLVQHPNSFFMDVKCPGCYKITTVFSHAQTVVLCVGCSTVLCQPTGGRARLTEGCSYRKKQH
ncbi:40S ribosomal protein S27 [Centruroides sculpturatus]|uniref:40S ribosomal protein S27 n=1 Tax=Centruroides sculpturatus TaxID=218467 RepID=UPI000C6D538E|nr:40S ribosomal protein S27 [Centruroides sculpturatus]